MPLTRRSRFLLLLPAFYIFFSVVAGIFLGEATLHPARRELTPEAQSAMVNLSHQIDSDLHDVSLTTPDSVTLNAWTILPHHNNGDAVIFLHGLGDNRLGMAGYAQILLAHGFMVLLPDARAHGSSGGQLATYGLLERGDIHQWVGFLSAQNHPHCIYALGESMGAAELLQSLSTEPRFCAIVAESSFANFREIAFDRMGQPFHLGTWFGRTLLRPIVESAFIYVRFKYGLNMQQVSPADAVAKTVVPVLLIHGSIDTNIPFRHALLIHDRNPAVVLWEVPNADHCGAFNADPREFDRRLIAWFANHPKANDERLSTNDERLRNPKP
jgi:pimeloyl-ACP methyl ester carboxylesterase